MRAPQRRVRPAYRSRSRTSPPEGSAGPGGAADSCLLHLSGSEAPIRGVILTSPEKRFLPLHSEDLRPVESAIAQGDRPLAAIERLTTAGSRTHRFVPVLALRLEPGGGVVLREMVVVR